MKRIVNASLRGLLAVLFASACGATVARAQVRDARVISARAGGVNFVSGDVSARRAGEADWRGLSPADELKGGDAVRTGADGRVEVLLNPGSYFRAAGGAEFTLANASLEDLRVGLTRGSAVVEATGYSDLDLSITIATPRGLVRILRSGVYRVNVVEGGAAEVAVLKGRAEVGGTLVKGGKVAREGAGGVWLSKLDKDGRDALDLWSRERGKELARANEKLSRRGLGETLALARADIFQTGWGRHSSGGVWLWNTRFRCYTFLPFYADWRSPYGFWYNTGVRYYPGPTNNSNSPVYVPAPVSRGGAPYTPAPAPSPGSPGFGDTRPGPPSREMPHREMPVPRRDTMTVERPPHRDQR